MYTNSAQCPTQIEEFRTVQVQCLYCRPACGSTPTDDQKILTPCKVPYPALAARIEERGKSSGLRVKCMSFIVFMAITRWACPGQFGHRVPGATHARQDMFTDKRCTRVAGRMLTVFTPIMGTLAHLLPYHTRDGFTRHPLRSSNQWPSSRCSQADPVAVLTRPTPRPSLHSAARPVAPRHGIRPTPSESTCLAHSWP